MLSSSSLVCSRDCWARRAIDAAPPTPPENDEEAQRSTLPTAGKLLLQRELRSTQGIDRFMILVIANVERFWGCTVVFFRSFASVIFFVCVCALDRRIVSVCFAFL